MSKVPIEIIKVVNENQYRGDAVRFQVVVREKGQNWDRCFECGLDDLIKFRTELSVIIDSISWYQKLGIEAATAAHIEKANTADEICSSCNFKQSKNCVTCLTVLQSPLERKLYPKLLESNIYFEVQFPLNRFGKKAHINNSEEKDLRLKYADLLTQPDFYLPNGRRPICVYTDGHSYHERTEEQAKRDRGIDRKLQELGFVVMRFTGKDVRESIDKVVGDIRKMVEAKN
ncbi:hypothetical protein CJD36_016705 [Flavipsychrobacter stenotrophus]|uniref:DUF559 domain-containing protein n=1 Tax=Flavipsychrobacter stenotrophus TaxID=2077091 RepID=A0A2S7SRP2_9BACT|nr:DUF559 domain-containing protein [Flavipsychrobacter stenotrophus]PQJ09579.1 hypothetical protein CJD36_016705 [Flavipsychrobacter stenotrophus]